MSHGGYKTSNLCCHCLIGVGLGMVLLSAPLRAGDLEPGIKLQANGKEIDVPIGHLVPCFFDWDGDGLRDLIVGQFREGRIEFYRNTGSTNAAQFAAPVPLRAEGKPIKLNPG